MTRSQSQAMVTIVAPLDPLRIADAEAAIDGLGNPARPDLAAALDRLDGDAGIHFASLHALPSFTAGKAHLVLEFSADGDRSAAIDRLAGAIGPALDEVFRLASDRGEAAIGQYLSNHTIRTGYGLGANPGVGHCGSPGMSVGRIRAERDLFDRASAILAGQGGEMSALARLDGVRAVLRATDPDFLPPADAVVPFAASDVLSTILATGAAFLTTFAWPWLVVFASAWIVGVLGFILDHQQTSAGTWAGVVVVVKAVIVTTAWLALIGVLASVGFVALLYVRLRRKEQGDWISDRAPDPGTLHAIFLCENHEGYAHNHMVSLTERKPGWLRYFALRLIFFAIATVNPLLYRPGYLGSIGTIHFARWITIPGTRDLVFFSNYGGSWESYLEDFITLAHVGLTGVWSNAVGFPLTENLVGLGATDGERFKRFARQSMLPTRFWYSAYPDLNTDMIRVNAAVRRGLSGAMTEDDASLWLGRFGSTLRPDINLVSTEIQSLMFGGLNFLPCATATFWRLPSDRARARAWLADIAADIAWNDGRRVRDDVHVHAVFQIGFGAGGLAKLGLPDEGLATFPPAFLDGMDKRGRVLGDTRGNAAANWWWQEPADATVLVYGETAEARDGLLAHLTAVSARSCVTAIHQVPLRDVPRHLPAEADPYLPCEGRHHPAHDDPEPFGFADGISQPLILGTYKAQRADADPLHVVAPGEFILGYPDNRGNCPPGPTLSALHDPDNLLSVPDPDPSYSRNDVNQRRDLGRNGSFLVIRQLEQDVDGFAGYCAEQAIRLRTAQRLGAPYDITPDFVGAKLVGRWKNGAPLVRSPYSESRSRAIIAENGFRFGAEDPEALRCPFGAHIRRSNPRDSLNPGSDDQIAISNRHRIIRVGRKYQPRPGQKPGLLFMCLNGDIERQFEFIQQTWINGNVISLSCPTNLSGESDPLLGNGSANTGFTIPTRDGPVKLSPLQQFVTLRGGGYFFMPGKRLVQYLARQP